MKSNLAREISFDLVIFDSSAQAQRVCALQFLASCQAEISLETGMSASLPDLELWQENIKTQFQGRYLADCSGFQATSDLSDFTLYVLKYLDNASHSSLQKILIQDQLGRKFFSWDREQGFSHGFFENMAVEFESAKARTGQVVQVKVEWEGLQIKSGFRFEKFLSLKLREDQNPLECIAEWMEEVALKHKMRGFLLKSFSGTESLSYRF